MFCVNNLMKEKLREDHIEEDESKFSVAVSHQMSSFHKRRYDKVMKMLYELRRKIEKDSGWKWLGSEFIFRSDFHYDPDYEEIAFQTSHVKVDGTGIRFDNEKGEKFVKKYHSLLERLVKLEKKRDVILSTCLPEIMRELEIPNIESIRNPRHISDHMVSDYVAWQARTFVSDYGIEGLSTLIKWLNAVSNKEHPIDAYEELSYEYMSTKKRKTLLSWVSTYTTGGVVLYDQFLENEDFFPPPHIEFKEEKTNIFQFPRN